MKASRPFHFKQFTIKQEKAAMKVGTDGVLLGSWVNIPAAGKILDVGTGTGLIALMLAQRCDLLIDAIEPEPAAFEEAKQNIADSPWPQQVQLEQYNLQEFVTKTSEKYSLVVCNPPFFRQSLLSGSAAKNQARHQMELTLELLFSCASHILEKNGRLAIIYPAEDLKGAEAAAAERSFHFRRLTFVKPTPVKPPKRVLIEASKAAGAAETADLIVEIARHQYSEEFKKMAADFYLKI